MNIKTKICSTLLILNSIIGFSQNTVEKSSEMNIAVEKAEKFYGDKKYKKAIEMYTLALTYDTNNIELYTKRAGTFFQVGDFENAINDYTKVLELNSENQSTIYFMRGLCKTLLKKEDKKGACLDIKKAIDLGYDVSNLNGLDEYCNFKK